MHSAEPRTPLDLDELRRVPVGPGAAWRRIDVVEETGSTNADLLARAAAGENIDGAVLVAEHQTAGRGRHGRKWSAPPRSQIALSIGVAAADLPAHTWGWLPLATGVAVVDALSEVTGIVAGLKWPNDVLVGDGKLAGILAEVAAPQPVIVIGLGLNVTMTPRGDRLTVPTFGPGGNVAGHAGIAGHGSKCLVGGGASSTVDSDSQLARRRRC